MWYGRASSDMFLSCMSAQIHKCAVLSMKWKISFLVLVYLTLHLLDISDRSRKREKQQEIVHNRFVFIFSNITIWIKYRGNSLTMDLVNAMNVYQVPNCILSISILEKEKRKFGRNKKKNVLRRPRFCKPRGWPSVCSKRPTADEPIVGVASLNNASVRNNFERSSSLISPSDSDQSGL